MNLKKRNKKAGFYAVFLVLTTIILTGYVIQGFTLSRNKIDSSFGVINKVLEFSQEIDKQEIYENEKVKGAASQAFYETSQELIEASDDCKIINHNGKEYLIFNQNCNPELGYLADSFLEKMNDYKSVEEYFFSLEGGNLELKAQGEEIEEKLSFSGSFTKYNLLYNLDASFSFLLADENIHLIDFVNAYLEAERCKNEGNVQECMQLDRLEINFEESTYNFFDFKTKKYYFYEKQEQKVFAPIEFRFALE